MGLETGLKTTVGDAQPAVKASLSITVTDGNLNPNDALSVTNVDSEGVETETVLTQGTEFTGGSGDDALAGEVAALLNAIAGFEASATNNVITLTSDIASRLGNDKFFSAPNQGAFNSGSTPANLAGGRDENEGIELEFEVDEAGVFRGYLDGTEVMRVNWNELDFDNQSTFQVNLNKFLRKAQC